MFSQTILAYLIVLSRIIEIFSLNLDLKKWAFSGNYLTKNSKTQNRLHATNVLIFNHKESPTYWWGFLQLTTYETQSSLWCGAAALSPSPCPERTDMVLTPESGDMFKIFSN